ncbi:uncharacterized protein DAT39_009781, partial [Clarias magur]
IQVSAAVGSTVVLSCVWRDLSIQTPHVEWTIGPDTVFERQGKVTFQGSGYEGRVDVPEDELLKGNCSLVLKNEKQPTHLRLCFLQLDKHPPPPFCLSTAPHPKAASTTDHVHPLPQTPNQQSHCT